MPRTRSSNKNSTANLGFEAKLWLAADKLRSNMDAAEYKHVSNRIGQDKPARGKRRFGLATRARRVRPMGNQPKQSNPTTRRLPCPPTAVYPPRRALRFILHPFQFPSPDLLAKTAAPIMEAMTKAQPARRRLGDGESVEPKKFEQVVAANL